MQIPFNKPLVLGTEKANIADVLDSGNVAANGSFTKKCHQFLQSELNYDKSFLTTSCTSALELAALLLDIVAGDEVIVPSYAFVTTANAFATKGAKIVFCDSREDNPNIDETAIERLISPKTKAIVALHYGGVACNMDAIMAVAKKHSVAVIEDSAQGIGSFYNGKPLGGIGDVGAISFHETKNVHCGEGGALLVNNAELVERAGVVWDMGTNKADFRLDKVSSYEWVDVGSSFYPSELNAAFLFAQLTELKKVNKKRMELWKVYYSQLSDLGARGLFVLPQILADTLHNAHTFYLVTKSIEERDTLIQSLKEQGISAPFHFQSLHKSAFFSGKHDGPPLSNSDRFSDCLVRLPLYHELRADQQQHVIYSIRKFYGD